MDTTDSIIVYLSIWLIVFFSVLLIGIKSQHLKFKDDLYGNEGGAPKNPKIARKFLMTTLTTSILFSVIYYLVSYGYLNLRGYLQ